MKSRLLFSCFLTLVLAFPMQLLPAQGMSTLRVKITGLRDAQGFVYVALYSQADGFPGVKAKAFRMLHGAIQGRESVVEFEQVPYGSYAIVVYHDENANGQFDMNMLGIPKEGWGASNNPRPKVRAPRFDEARFEVQEPAREVDISVAYVLHSVF